MLRNVGDTHTLLKFLRFEEELPRGQLQCAGARAMFLHMFVFRSSLNLDILRES